MFNTYTERTYFNMKEASLTPKSLAETSEHSESPYVATLTGYIYKKYAKNWIVYTDVGFVGGTIPEDAVVDDVAVESWKTKFGYIIDTTFDRYSKLLELYNAHKDDLLNKLGTESTTKFNDTPQEQNIVSDGYTSTTTTHTAAVDPGEMINRLKNIDENFQNVYKDWIKEFAPLFGDEI